MKQGKRLLASVLATMLLLTAMPLTGLTAMAEDGIVLPFDSPMTVRVDPEECTYVYFTPTEDGVFHIYSAGDSIDPVCYLYEGENEITSDDDGGTDRNFSLYAFLRAGTTYELRIESFNEYAGDIVVRAEASDIVSVDFEDMAIIYDANFRRYSDWVDDEYVEWKVQEYDHNLRCTITKKDGTVLTEEDIYIDATVSDNQGYGNEWEAGQAYTATVSALGFTDTITVKVLESPFVSATATKVTVIKNTCGDWDQDWVYNEELDEYVYTPEYWHYDIWGPCLPEQIVLQLKDGSTYILSEDNDYCFLWNGCDYGLGLSSGQCYEKQWGVGKHTCTGYLADFEFSYEVEIEENPITSVKGEPIYLLEGIDGRWTTTNYYDENDVWTQSPEFFEYHVPRGDVTVTLKDGTEIFLPADQGEDSFEWNGYSFHLDWWSEQDYFNQWTVGKNTAYGEIGGFEFTYDAYVMEVNYNDEFQYIVTDDGAIITGWLMASDVLEIPATIDDHPVVGVSYLGDWWQAEELILPDSVVNVDEELFYGLWNLRSVHFGAAVKDLTPEMFEELYLEELTVSSDNPNYCVKNNVLYNKEMTKIIALAAGSIENYEVPASVEDISALFLPVYSDIAVTFASGNKNFVTENGVTYNKDKTQIIMASKALSGNYVMPNTVELIAPNAFRGCEGLTQVTVSSKVTDIAYGAFADCTALNKVTLPTELITINEEAFMNTAALTDVDLPEKLEFIGYCSFAFSGLTSLKVPDSMVFIDARSFYRTALTSLQLGKSVEYIGSYAFAYTQIPSVVLPDCLLWMSSGVFEGCSKLASVTFGKNLTEICDSTFYGTALTKLQLPDHIQYVGAYAFAYSDITEITFGNPAVWLDEGTFAGCPLKDLQLTNQMKEIPQYAFYNTTLTSLTVPYGVTGIMYGAFMGSEDLASIDLPTTVIEMGGHTFDDTAWYEAQPEGLVYLDHVLYSYKGDIPENATLVVKDGTKVIADYALENDSETPNTLKELYLPPSVEYIGWWFFGYRDDTVISGVAGSYAQQYAEENGYTFVAKTLNGWVKSGNDWTYYKNGAMVISQWIKDGGKWYYLNQNGIMAADTFAKDSKGLVYLEKNGVMSTASGWVKSNGKWYYLNKGYASVSKWIKDSKGWVYLGSDGAMVTNGWAKDGSYWSYLGADGYMVKDKWIKDGGKWYILDKNGHMVSNAWKKDSKGWVYVGADGAMKTNAWVKDSVGWCYVGADGYAVTNCWKKDSVGWCYLNASGSMTKDAWIKDGGKWYYLDKNGYMATNAWKKDSKGWVYVGKDGAMLTNAWCKDSKGWCYVGADGYAVTNCWKKDSHGWIWLDKNGSMTKNAWVKDGGKWYYLDQNGYMVANTSMTIGGKKYNFNSSGVCTNP